jgi:tetratricopeptide (TPR) repeat protein
MLRLARLAIAIAIPAAGWILAGPRQRALGLLTGCAIVIVLFLALLLIERFAHSSFEDGQHRQARILYKILRVTSFDRGKRAAIDVSLAGCKLARDDFSGALRDLERIDPTWLSPSEKAAWLNNRAYARARGRLDAAAGLAEVNDAMKLRPDVPGYRHTRGVVLIAMDRLDDAIVDLDTVWSDLAADKAASVLLEAERCYDLGTAWARKGETDYARDYFLRARGIAPRSTWSTRAAEWLRGGGPGPGPGPRGQAP